MNLKKLFSFMQFRRKECHSVMFNERSVSLIKGDKLQWEVPLEQITAFGHETTTVPLNPSLLASFKDIPCDKTNH